MKCRLIQTDGVRETDRDLPVNLARCGSQTRDPERGSVTRSNAWPRSVSLRSTPIPASLLQTSPSGSTLCSSRRTDAFTLLEVIIACAIFFMVIVSILQMVTQGLSSAKALQVRHPDPGLVLAALSLTNAFEEGSISGNYEDIAPATYPGYRWEAFITEIGSNGLFKIEVLTYNEKKPGVSPATITGAFWRPNSKPGSVTKGGF